MKQLRRFWTTFEIDMASLWAVWGRLALLPVVWAWRFAMRVHYQYRFSRLLCGYGARKALGICRRLADYEAKDVWESLIEVWRADKDMRLLLWHMVNTLSPEEMRRKIESDTPRHGRRA